YGEVWPTGTIAQRRGDIEAAGLDWCVVESLPLHESIKTGEGDLAPLFANYRQSMANLAAEGIRTICYNFMPLLDWTRTDLAAPIASGGTCLRYDSVKMAAFELHMLARQTAENDYPDDVCNAAKTWFESSTQTDRDTLLHSIMSGLPGAYDRYSVAELKKALDSYRDIDRTQLRANYSRFLQEVVPAAEELGVSLCVHPDDPPRDILGLPRIVSDAADIDWILQARPSDSNGLTLCSGSLGANPTNDVVAIAQQFADKIRFAHLRNVRKEPNGSFEEAAHLDGDTDMVALVRVLIEEERRRLEQQTAYQAIPMRPDHGHDLLDDHKRQSHPGYPLIGRLRGLAELRGVSRALESTI
ncbi:MAG: mannonate dehydratase, partial [Granulosicoccaceae bacterium]